MAALFVAPARAASVPARNFFDLVISDVGLPDGTGHELMGLLHEQYQLRATIAAILKP